MKRKTRIIILVLMLIIIPLFLKTTLSRPNRDDRIDGGSCPTCGSDKPDPKPPTPPPNPPKPPEPNCYYTICTRTNYETKYKCSRGKSSYAPSGGFVDGGPSACRERTVYDSYSNPGSCTYCHFRVVYR